MPAETATVQKGGKMNVFQTSLSLVSAFVGGGILGYPYAFYSLGLANGIIITILMAIISHCSNMLYVKTCELLPKALGCQTIYDIAYLLFGRPAVYVVLGSYIFNTFGASLLYYMLIGDTISSLTEGVLSRTVVVMLAGLIHVTIIFKRKLEEMVLVSYLLNATLPLFVLLVGY